MQIFFLLILILRSSLDYFTHVGLHIGPVFINIPSIAAALILLEGGLFFFLRRSISKNKIAVIFGLWLLSLLPFVLLSILNFGPQGLLAAREWIRLLTILMVFLLSYHLFQQQNKEKYINLLYLSLIIPILMGVFQIFAQSGKILRGLHRIYGTLSHPNDFACYLVLFIGLTLWKITTSKNRLWFIVLICESIALVLTFSLTGYVMFGVMCFLLFWKANKRQKVVLFCFIGMFSVAVIICPQSYKRYERLKKTNIRKTIKTRDSVNSFTWRIVNWSGLLERWKEKPIMGHGLNSSRFINPKKKQGVGRAPHNDFLKYLVETGLIGLLLYLGFVGAIGFQIYRLYKTSADEKLNNCIFVLFVVFLAWQIGSLVGNFMARTAFQFYFWAFLGLASSRPSNGELWPSDCNKIKGSSKIID
ncbi:MAG: O-antigen ligase family protein [Planctomycetota bacterium]|jgi:O-antigen ligase